MHLNRLSEYLAVLEHGSIGAAADALGLSQPGLSKAIRRLEEELGVPLLERLPRGVRPTVYGEVLRDCASAVSRETERAFSEIDSIRHGTRGTVRAGAGPDWLFTVVPRAVAALHQRSPEVRVRFFGGFNDELHAMLSSREIDFCLATIPDGGVEPGVQHEHWITDHFQVVARRGHPVHRQRKLTLERLLEYPWVLPTATPMVRRTLEKLYLGRDLPAPEPALETNYMSLCLSAVKGHDYLSWMSELQLRLLRDPQLVPVSLPEARVMRRAGLVTRRDEQLAPAARALVAELKQICDQDFRPHAHGHGLVER